MATKTEAKKPAPKTETASPIDALITRLREADKGRKGNPVVGREADEAMMALCQYVKDHPQMPKADRDRAVKSIKALNLRPYWNYCREHMLDIGLEF